MAHAATMQLQLQTAQTRVSRQASPKAFVSAPFARKVAVRSFAAPAASRTAGSRMVVRAVAEAKAPAAAATGAQEWYACVASADFFFNDVQNEPFAEQLREKKRFFDEQEAPCDFYIVPQPAWLAEKFPDLDKRVKKPAVALISTDPVWITFMKLRLDRVLKVDLGKMTMAEVTKSNGKIPEFPKPNNWIAPYAPYAHGWWEVFEHKQ